MVANKKVTHSQVRQTEIDGCSSLDGGCGGGSIKATEPSGTVDTESRRLTQTIGF